MNILASYDTLTPVTVPLVLSNTITYNYTAYLSPTKTSFTIGETFYVDVMLGGDINYTQVLAEIAYNNNLLQYNGYSNLHGWVAVCAPASPNKISLRSVPSSNMVIGMPCSPAVRIVTLQFTVLDAFSEESIETDLAFSSVTVTPPPGYIGATTAPSLPVKITLYQE